MRRVYAGVALAATHFYVTRIGHHERVHREGAAVFGGPDIVPFMASQAVAVRHTLRIKYLSHLVRLVTIDACRKDIRFLFPQFTFDDLAVDAFDLRVTLRARCGDVPTCDGRIRIGMGKDRVRGVAGGAVGGDNEPFPEQSFTVNALGEILEDMVLMDRPRALDRRPFLMALGACEGNLQRRDWRRRMFDRLDCMRTVAIGA